MSAELNLKQPPVELVTITTKSPPTQINNRLQTGTTKQLTIDKGALEKELHSAVKGEVRFGGADRGMYASDASNYRMVPLGVILPRDAEDVVAAVAACRKYGAPIFARGGGTAIPGQTVNDGVLFDFSKYMNRIHELDPEAKRARVEPGAVLDSLRDAANKYNLTFGPDPATHSRCTLGGMIGNNSCGVHSVMAGETSDNIEELEILTYDGTRMRVGATSEDQLETIIRSGGERSNPLSYAGLNKMACFKEMNQECPPFCPPFLTVFVPLVKYHAAAGNRPVWGD